MTSPNPPHRPIATPRNPPTPHLMRSEEDWRRWLILAIAVLGGLLIAVLLALWFQPVGGHGQDGFSKGTGTNARTLGTGDPGNQAEDSLPPSGLGKVQPEAFGIGEDRPQSLKPSPGSGPVVTSASIEVPPTAEVAFHIYESPSSASPVADNRAPMHSSSSGGKGSVVLGEDGSSPFTGDAMSAKSIVFVFDISFSMGPPSERWPRVRACLIQALNKLQPSQKIKLIAFNAFTYLDPITPTGKLYPANTQNVKRATEWVNSLSLGGGTCPLQGMLHAIAQKPDVIYLLSDGDFTEIVDCVAEITRANQQSERPSIIHCIEVDKSVPNLMEIASRNGGTIQHTVTP